MHSIDQKWVEDIFSKKCLLNFLSLKLSWKKYQKNIKQQFSVFFLLIITRTIIFNIAPKITKQWFNILEWFLKESLYIYTETLLCIWKKLNVWLSGLHKWTFSLRKSTIFFPQHCLSNTCGVFMLNVMTNSPAWRECVDTSKVVHVCASVEYYIRSMTGSSLNKPHFVKYKRADNASPSPDPDPVRTASSYHVVSHLLK